MATRNLLIVGATGKQGRAAINALLSLDPPPPVHIFGLSRNPESAKAKELAAAHPNTITLLRGDLGDASAVFAQQPAGSIQGLYLFTMPGSPEDVIGKAWIDAALAHGVTQIVLSTVDRGGADRSWDNPTYVPHFMQKHAVELYLREQVAARPDKQIYWTVLRPTAFLDNLAPGFFCSVFNGMWSLSQPSADRKLQFVSVRDLGIFAAKALASPADWDRKAVSLAGEEMTLTEAKERFKAVVGQEMPQSWWIFARLLLWLLPDVSKMFAWFGTDGYGADIAALKKTEPGLQNFETWLKDSSGWPAKKE